MEDDDSGDGLGSQCRIRNVVPRGFIYDDHLHLVSLGVHSSRLKMNRSPSHVSHKSLRRFKCQTRLKVHSTADNDPLASKSPSHRSHINFIRICRNCKRTLPASVMNLLLLILAITSSFPSIHSSRSADRNGVSDHIGSNHASHAVTSIPDPSGIGRICPSIDVRNSASNLKLLNNCTIIDGSLSILLIENGQPEDYENFTFPLLREVRDYVLITRAWGLTSIGKLFPNLSIIRGVNLFHEHYAFIVFEMNNLEEIGLSSLTNIMAGSVRIDNNALLCYADYINWDKIAPNGAIPNFVQRKEKYSCPPCTAELRCDSAQKSTQYSALSQANSKQTALESSSSYGDLNHLLCWNPHKCQKFCSPICSTLNRIACYVNTTTTTATDSLAPNCCHEECIGGCTGPSNTDCIACKNARSGNVCRPKCEDNMFLYGGWLCVTRQKCKNMFLKAAAGVCQANCPAGYEDDKHNPGECAKCDGKCTKVCDGIAITSLTSIKKMEDCTIINGTIEIMLNGRIDNLHSILEDSFKYVTEIVGHLKVARSHQLKSLSFFHNLTKIHGKTEDTEGFFNGTALIVQDNQQLTKLFDEKLYARGTTLTISGNVYIHSNPQLCYDEISKLKTYSTVQQWDEKDVSRYTNGDRAACHVESLNVTIYRTIFNAVVIHWEDYRIRMTDPRDLLSYLIYFKQVDSFDDSIPYNEARDMCGEDKELEWSVTEFAPSKRTNNDTTNEVHIITDLKPFTKYTLYIDTFVIPSKSDNFTRRARSKLHHFTTRPITPSTPQNLKARAHRQGELLLEWEPPTSPNGIIGYYTIEIREVHHLTLNKDQDYCVTSPTYYDGQYRVTNETFNEPPIYNNVTDAMKSPFNITTGTGSLDCDCNAKPKAKIDQKLQEDRKNFEDVVMNLIFVRNTNKAASYSYEEEPIGTEPNGEADSTTTISRKRRRVSESMSDSELNNSLDKYENSPNLVISTLNESVVTTTITTSSAINISQPIQATKDRSLQFFTRRVNATNSQPFMVIQNLTHFTQYDIKVHACHNKLLNDKDNSLFKYDECSVPAVTIVKTLPAPMADDLDFTSIKTEQDNGTYNTYIIKWDEPQDPNGAIASYKVEYQPHNADGTAGAPHYSCVDIDTYNKHNGTILSRLPAGNYSIRIQAISFAQKGNWTVAIFLYVPDRNTSLSPGLIITFVLLSAAVLVALVGVAIWVRRKDHLLETVTVNPVYFEENFYKPDGWEVDEDKVKLLVELGRGSFGVTWEGTILDLYPTDPPGTITRCAVKTPHEHSVLFEIRDFLREANHMKSFNSQHVVKLLGIVHKRPYYVLMELMKGGDLRTYLRKNRPDSETLANPRPPTLKQCLQFALDIADGMAYIAEKKFVHGDLACRNCLLAEDLTVKVSDFGMTRDIYTTNYYRKNGSCLLPARWMAPEALQDGLFTSSTDVWAYGVVLWEIVTLAHQPYGGMDNGQVCEWVKQGGTMERPENCPDMMWELMRNCWSFRPAGRPTFIEILDTLADNASDEFKAVSFYFKEYPNISREGNGEEKQADEQQQESQENDGNEEHQRRDHDLNDHLEGTSAEKVSLLAPNANTSSTINGESQNMSRKGSYEVSSLAISEGHSPSSLSSSATSHLQQHHQQLSQANNNRHSPKATSLLFSTPPSYSSPSGRSSFLQQQQQQSFHHNQSTPTVPLYQGRRSSPHISIHLDDDNSMQRMNGVARLNEEGDTTEDEELLRAIGRSPSYSHELTTDEEDHLLLGPEHSSSVPLLAVLRHRASGIIDDDRGNVDPSLQSPPLLSLAPNNHLGMNGRAGSLPSSHSGTSSSASPPNHVTTNGGGSHMPLNGDLHEDSLALNGHASSSVEEEVSILVAGGDPVGQLVPNDGSKGSKISGKSNASNGSMGNGHLAHYQTTAC